MYAVVGVIIGLILNRLVIYPIYRKRLHDECIKEGLIPKDW